MNTVSIWNRPPADLTLSPNAVHLWRASLSQPPSVIQSLSCHLHEDELARAYRFYFEKDRHHFIVARGLLRVLLGRYLALAPARIRLSYNSYGKPALDLPSQEPVLHFNLSHSHDLVLYAFAWSRQLGIDAEAIRPHLHDYEQLAQRFFSPLEVATLQSLPESERQSAFFRCWTRKEAYIKARGKGLSLPLDSFDVSLHPEKPAMLLQSREDHQEPKRWQLYDLAPATGYAGALAVEGQEHHLHSWQYLFA